MGKFLAALLVTTVSSFSQAEDIRVDFLDTPEEVHKEFCRTEKLSSFGDCGENGHKKVITLYIPKSIGALIIAHIDQAKKDGFYDDLSPQDFFHGHPILHGPHLVYTSVEDYFSDYSALLYHSAEYNNRWEKERKAGVPTRERRARSFVGFLDGTVQKAIEFLRHDSRAYKGYDGAGTVYADGLVEALPELSEHPYNSSNQTLTLNVCKGRDCRTCEVFPQMNIIKESGGRFKTASGEEVELYIRCLYPRN